MPSETSPAAERQRRHRVGTRRRLDDIADDLAALRAEVRSFAAIAVEQQQNGEQEQREQTEETKQ